MLMLASKNLILFNCILFASVSVWLARIQYLPAQGKDPIQDFCNWIENSPETSTRSTPVSRIIWLIENSTTLSPSVDISGTSMEPTLEVPTSTPSAAGEGTSSAGGCGGDRAEGSKNPTFRLVPFQSMPKST